MGAKVQFSTEEMRLVTDPAWILTKNSVVRKVVELFGEFSGEWRESLSREGGATGLWGDPKVSKGEQYKGLPWVMLDYPRIFGKEDVLAVRTMFWWGHYFSVTLHLKGSYLRSYLPVILARRAELEAAGFWPGSSADEWEHDHRPGEWEMGAWETGIWEMGARKLSDRPFLKVSARCELDQSEILTEKFGVLARVLITTQPVK
jgi:hypothetical protein